MSDDEREATINALAADAARAAKNTLAAGKISAGIKEGLAVVPVPTEILAEDRNALGLRPGLTRDIIHSVAAPIVGITCESASVNSVGALHAGPGADPGYVSQRDETLECLSKAHSANSSGS